MYRPADDFFRTERPAGSKVSSGRPDLRCGVKGGADGSVVVASEATCDASGSARRVNSIPQTGHLISLPSVAAGNFSLRRQPGQVMTSSIVSFPPSPGACGK